MSFGPWNDPRRHARWLFLSLLILAGCGGSPKLDATSKDSLKASITSITEGMTDAQKKQFGTDCAALTKPGIMQSNQGTFGNEVKAAPTPTELYAPLQGLTADEIHTKAEEARRAPAAKK